MREGRSKVRMGKDNQYPKRERSREGARLFRIEFRNREVLAIGGERKELKRVEGGKKKRFAIERDRATGNGVRGG